MNVMTPYHSELRVRRDGFAQLLRADAPLWLGTDVDNGKPTGGFAGSLDELVFYNRVLSPDDIMKLWNAAMP